MIKINTSKRKYFAALIWCAIVFFALALLKDPQTATASATGALAICYKSVIPALFPYMVISSLIVSSGLACFAGRVAGRPFSALFAINGNGAAAFFIGLAAGFPVGAKTAASLYHNGMCTKEEAQRLCIFCNNTGPAFVIAGVGGFLGNYGYGAAIYIIEVISALAVGMLLSVGKSRNSGGQHTFVKFTPDLTAAIRDAVFATLTVCGFVIFFSVLLTYISSLLSLISNSACTSALAAALLEVTSGTREAALLGGRTGFIICAFAVGWSGLCVHAQSAAFLVPEGLSVKKYMAGKLLCALVCTLLAAIYTVFFIKI